MDKDDPDSGKPQDLFEDESAFEEAPEGAALPQGEEDAGEWHEQPVDDLAESGEAYVEEIATPGEEGHEPVEDEFASAGAEGMEGMEGVEDETSSARENAEQYLPPEASSSKPDLMKYLPYAGAGAVLLLLGFFGFQQISNMMGGGQQETTLTPPPMHTAAAPPPPTPPAPPPASSPPVGSTASSGEYILNPNAPPPPLPSSQLAPPPSAANVENMEQQLSTLNGRLEDMKRNQERIEEQLRNIQNAPPPPNLPATDPATQNSVRMLEEKFAVLEQRIGSSPSAATAGQQKKTPSSSEPEATTGAGETDKPAVTKPKKKKTAHKKSSPLPGQWQQPGYYRQQAMPWILRSAQPGTAWLSQGMSSELQRVVPGDKLPGLGTIVSVRMVAGRWLVEGTQGSVR